MPKIPKTISQIVENQLPEFVRDNYPQFIAFLQAYYEFVEQNGATVYTAKILDSSPNQIVLPNTASTVLNAYQKMNIVCLNGPTKGHTRSIESYDPTTNTITVFPSWTPGFIPLPNTTMAIRDNFFPNKLLEYRDIDRTLDQFITYFRDEFLYQIPGDILADPRKLLKHIKTFYQGRGSENSFRFLFRLLYNEEINMYYPKVDVLRTDDGIWVVDHVMRVTTTENTFDWTSRQIKGHTSGATASVEAVHQKYINGNLVSDLYLSNINGTFGNTGNGEYVSIMYPFVPPPQTDLGAVSDLLEPATINKFELAYLLLSSLIITNPGDQYQVNDPITITQMGALLPASAYVSAVFQTFFSGSCQVPPSPYYLEPYWGANTEITQDPTGQTDNTCIPGLYYFGDVLVT